MTSYRIRGTVGKTYTFIWNIEKSKDATCHRRIHVAYYRITYFVQGTSTRGLDSSRGDRYTCGTREKHGPKNRSITQLKHAKLITIRAFSSHRDAIVLSQRSIILKREGCQDLTTLMRRFGKILAERVASLLKIWCSTFTTLNILLILLLYKGQLVAVFVIETPAQIRQIIYRSSWSRSFKADISSIVPISLYDLLIAHIAGWDPYIPRDLALLSSVGFVLLYAHLAQPITTTGLLPHSLSRQRARDAIIYSSGLWSFEVCNTFIPENNQHAAFACTSQR